jgi:glycosyltransferase involved in cell wall biosynthesis
LSKNYFLIDCSLADISVAAVVGMAVYHQDRMEWISKAIQSILAQSYTDFVFVIVIDGRVSDDVLTLLMDSQKSDSRIRLVQNKQNLGLSSAMNLVIELTLNVNASYFFRMDADDISLPDRFKTQVTFFEAHPEVSVLGSALTEINEQGDKVGKRSLPTSHSEILRILPKRCAVNHPTVGLRYQIFKDGWRYKEYLKNTQDYFFWADLSAAGYKFANLPQQLLQFRRVNDFYKRRGLGKSFNEFKARFYTMKKIDQYTTGNVVYACSVMILRLMPSQLVKFAYKLDRYLLNKWVKHD